MEWLDRLRWPGGNADTVLVCSDRSTYTNPVRLTNVNCYNCVCKPTTGMPLFLNHFSESKGTTGTAVSSDSL